LSGGAIQENWLLKVICEGEKTHWVLRTDSIAAVASSLDRHQEFAVLTAAHAAEVPVARPVLAGDESVFGRRFFVTEYVEGVAAGHRLVKDDTLVPDRKRLAAELGRAMGRLHGIRPSSDVSVALMPLSSVPSRNLIDRLREQLDQLSSEARRLGDLFSDSWPTLEFGLRWCELNQPDRQVTALTHGDWRTGNYLVCKGRLSAVLDWEFAGWGNPMADIGWLFAKCWRFGRDDRRCGGVGTAEDFLDAYSRAIADPALLDVDQISYWELMAHLRWAVIALEQALRHRSGKQPSLELALTGHLVSSLEHEVLAILSSHAT